MESKRLMWFWVSVGSALGSYIPVLWGANMFSFSSVLLGGVGAFGGLWVAYRLG